MASEAGSENLLGQANSHAVRRMAIDGQCCLRPVERRHPQVDRRSFSEVSRGHRHLRDLEGQRSLREDICTSSGHRATDHWDARSEHAFASRGHQGKGIVTLVSSRPTIPITEPLSPICIVGAGYVGLVNAVCLVDGGIHVRLLDVDPERLAVPRQGKSPIHEPMLEELLRKVLDEGRLELSGDAARRWMGRAW